MEHYRDHIIFYVYRRSGDYKLVGRLVYDTSTVAPIKRGFDVKINGLSLGETFDESSEFQRRIFAVQECQPKSGPSPRA